MSAHFTATQRTRNRLLPLLVVLGPGLLAGLSDDDPAGITTYSVLGGKYGYQLLWVLLLSTIALVVFHSLGARMGVVTGEGLIGLVRQRYGVRLAAVALGALVLANLGTTCAEFAGLAAGFELFGIPRWVSVPTAAVVISLLVLRGSFSRIERFLMALATVFVAYIAAGFLAHPNWGEAARGLVVPSMPLNRDAIYLATATLGTTLAPWGLSFIQSYAVDKKLMPADLRFERSEASADRRGVDPELRRCAGEGARAMHRQKVSEVVPVEHAWASMYHQLAAANDHTPKKRSTCASTFETSLSSAFEGLSEVIPSRTCASSACRCAITRETSRVKAILDDFLQFAGPLQTLLREIPGWKSGG